MAGSLTDKNNIKKYLVKGGMNDSASKANLMYKMLKINALNIAS